MRRAGPAGVSANRITLLRDADGDDVAQIHGVFLEHLNQLFGMAALGDTFYDSVQRVRIRRSRRKLATVYAHPRERAPGSA